MTSIIVDKPMQLDLEYMDEPRPMVDLMWRKWVPVMCIGIRVNGETRHIQTFVSYLGG